jgi:hypothetical protein
MNSLRRFSAPLHNLAQRRRLDPTTTISRHFGIRNAKLLHGYGSSSSSFPAAETAGTTDMADAKPASTTAGGDKELPKLSPVEFRKYNTMAVSRNPLYILNLIPKVKRERKTRKPLSTQSCANDF